MNVHFSRLTRDQALAVYAVLQQNAGAYDDQFDRETFVRNYGRERPPTEYRFKGQLGMGGKFRFPRIAVDCYPEDETASRMAIIATTNEALNNLRKMFTLQQNPSGFFVDEDGQTRDVLQPGAGRQCILVVRLLDNKPYLGVDVVKEDGEVVHEATHYATLDDLRAVGVTVPDDKKAV